MPDLKAVFSNEVYLVIESKTLSMCYKNTISSSEQTNIIHLDQWSDIFSPKMK